jgi:hypothetical protein
MKKRNHRPKRGVPLGFALLCGLLVLSAIETIIQRMRYISYLQDRGIGTQALFVSPTEWLPFHMAITSITLDVIAVLPILLLAVGVIGKLNRISRKQNR